MFPNLIASVKKKLNTLLSPINSPKQQYSSSNEMMDKAAIYDVSNDSFFFPEELENNNPSTSELDNAIKFRRTHKRVHKNFNNDFGDLFDDEDEMDTQKK